MGSGSSRLTTGGEVMCLAKVGDTTEGARGCFIPINVEVSPPPHLSSLFRSERE